MEAMFFGTSLFFNKSFGFVSVTSGRCDGYICNSKRTPNNECEKIFVFLPMFKNFKNINVIGLLHTSMDRDICSYFKDCIYINDERSTIHSVIKKQLQESDSTIELNDNVLSNREIDVLKLLVRGYANKEIAEELFISAHTVVSHRKNISKKIGMKSSAAMAIYAAANNIIDINTVLKISK